MTGWRRRSRRYPAPEVAPVPGPDLLLLPRAGHRIADPSRPRVGGLHASDADIDRLTNHYQPGRSLTPALRRRPLLVVLALDGGEGRRHGDLSAGGTASASTVLHALMLELGRRGQVGEFCECLAAARPLRHELEALRRRLAAP